MKQLLSLFVLSLVVGFGLSAESLEDWTTARSAVKVGDLTVGDLKAWADAQSVRRQELRYVHGSAFGSFLLPGLGQFKTGDAGAGTLQLAGFVTLTGATLYGAWTLLPASVKADGLNWQQRKDEAKTLWSEDPAQMAPALGVMTAGAVVSLVYRFWSAGDAKDRALANLESDAVTFEPAALDGHFGFRMRM